MSVTHSVFLLAKRLPTAAQLNAALAKAKIDLQLDPEWNTRSNHGFWPAKFQGYDAGFEWLVQPIKESALEKQFRKQVSNYDSVVSLVTRADFNQLASAVAVWGVLASIADGVAYADESGDFFEPDDALALAQDQVAAPPAPAEPRIAYPREIDEPLAVIETRRTSHSLALEGSQGHYRVFLNTKAIPSPSEFVVARRLEHRKGEFSVLQLDVNRRPIRFTPGGRVLDPEYMPDYAALVMKLGDTESVALALRLGGPASAVALATFIRDDTIATPRRRLGIITLGLMASDASRALEALASLKTHSTLGQDATQAIDRIEVQSAQK